MALIVEDGTGSVINANSYVDLVAIKAYATARNVAYGSDGTLEVQAITAADWLESQSSRYVGSRFSLGQPLAWPRINVEIDGFDVPSTTIPVQLKNAQCALVLQQIAGIDLFPTSTGSFVTKETVGPITTEYSETRGQIDSPSMPSVEALLRPLYSNVSGFVLRTLRV